MVSLGTVVTAKVQTGGLQTRFITLKLLVIKIYLRPTVLVLCILTSACGLNSAVAIKPNAVKPMPGMAVIAFGVTVKSEWPYKGFGVILDRYDLRKQNITGNCIFYDHVEGLGSPHVGSHRYFSFSVRPGAYIYSPFNGANFVGPTKAFVIPSGQNTYLGNFVLSDQGVHLEDDLSEAISATNSQLTFAKSLNVQRPRPFLCTP